MADGLKVELVGVADLKTSFTNVDSNMRKKTALRMVASGGSVLRKEAKAIASSLGLRRTGAMINNIAIKREKAVPEGVVQYNLGVRHGRNITKAGDKKLLVKVGSSGRIVRANDPFYWRFQELGWTPRGPGQRLKGGERKKQEQRKAIAAAGGRRAGTPFISKALENKRAEAIAAMEARLAADLEKAGKK